MARRTMSADRSSLVRTIVIANVGFLVMVGLWGTFFPILERLLATWDVFSATVARHGLAALVLLSALALRERQVPIHRRLPWTQLMRLGLIGVTMSSLLTSVGVYLSGGVSAAIVSATNPITSAMVARLLHGVPLMPGIVIGTVLSTAGGLIAILGSGGDVGQLRGGEVLIVAANLVWTWYSIKAQQWLVGYSQLHITALTALPGVIGLWMIAGFVGITGLADLRIDVSAASILYMLYLGGVNVALGNFLWHYGVSRVGVTVGAMYGNLIPIAAVVVSLWFGVHPTPTQLVGGAVIIVGVLSAQIIALRRAGDHSAAREA
jgi:drug/metabolite transporter (DMT)-like permease